MSDEQLVRQAWDRAQPRLKGCLRQLAPAVSSTWKVTVDIRADGSIKTASATGSPHNDAAATCIERMLTSSGDFGTLTAPRRAVMSLMYLPKS